MSQAGQCNSRGALDEMLELPQGNSRERQSLLLLRSRGRGRTHARRDWRCREEILDQMPPEVLGELQALMANSTSAEEFVNQIFVGDCPKCNSSETGDCEHDPRDRKPPRRSLLRLRTHVVHRVRKATRPQNPPIAPAGKKTSKASTTSSSELPYSILGEVLAKWVSGGRPSARPVSATSNVYPTAISSFPPTNRLH